MTEKLLETQERRLAELKQSFAQALDENPLKGHGGTPIVDNSRGRQRRKQLNKYEERLQSIDKAIKDQEAKIERTKARLDYRNTVTKKASAFISKNPIHEGLLYLVSLGKVKQWTRNPQLFFIVGMEKVALFTLNGRVGVNKKYGTTDPSEWAIAQELVKIANEYQPQ